MRGTKLLSLMLMVLCITLASCKKDGTTTTNDGGGSNPSNPTNCEDPEGTITANLRNDGGCINLLDTELKINTADNFYGTGNGTISSDTYKMTFVNVGEMQGLGCVNTVPQSGWSNQVAVIPGNGYVVKVTLCDWYGERRISYARLYVVRYILSANNEILGAELKYQDNWYAEPSATTKDVAEITQNSALCGCIVDGDYSAVKEIGICWKKDAVPTINDNHLYTEESTNNCEFRMTGLEGSTTYVVRAYIKSSHGDVLYGYLHPFTTL